MLLKKASALLKTDITYIVRGSTATVTGQGLISLIAFGSSIAFANLLPKDAYGTYQYILTLAELIAVASLTGLAHSVVRSVAQGYEGTLPYAFRKNLLWSVGTIIFGIGFALYFFWTDSFILAWGIVIATLGSPLIASAKLYLSHLIGKKLFGQSRDFSVIGAIVPALSVISTLLITDNVLIIIGAYFVSHGAINFILYRRSLRSITNETIDERTVPYAKHLSIQNIITRVAGDIDKVLLFHFAGAAALAEYFFAITIPRQFQHFFKSAKMVVLPKVSTRPFQELKVSLPRKVFFLYLFIIPILVLYIFAAPYIFRFFFPLYENAVLYSQIYALIFLFLPLTIFQDAIIGHAKQHILYYTNIATAVVKIITTFVFVPSYGILGVLISVLVTQALSSLQIMYYFYREKGTNDTSVTPSS